MGFFPKSYPADGALFLVLGKQDSNMGDVRPSELSWVEEIIGGIRPR